MRKQEKLKELEEYSKSDAINQSLLKDVLSGKTVREKHTVYTVLGSLADCLLTTPELFDELYFVSIAGRPTGHIKEIIDYLILNFGDVAEDLGELSDEIMEAKEMLDLLNNVKEKDTLLKKVLPFYDYYREEVVKGNKVVVTEEEHMEAENLVMQMRTHPVTAHVFANTEPNEESKFQIPIYFELEGLRCKGLLDILWKNHKDKLVRNRDVKITSSSLRSFLYNARKYRYDFQAAFYNEGLRQLFPDYEVLPPQLIVYSTSSRKPAIFELTPEDLEIGKEGCTITSSQIHTHRNQSRFEKVRVVEGYMDAIEIYKYCKRNNLDDYDMEYHVNQGFYNQSMWE